MVSSSRLENHGSNVPFVLFAMMTTGPSLFVSSRLP
jgi:hypothetical protein